MWSQKINLTDPERVFIIVKNGYSTAAITVGQVVVFDGTAADGLTVTIPATATRNLVAGVVKDASIAYGSYGQVQCYGYNSDCLVSGGTDVAVGDKLTAKNAVFNVIKEGGTVVPGESGVIVALQAFTTSTAAAKKVHIRCM